MKVIDLFFGHKRVEHDDGRVEHMLRKEAYDAVERSDAQVEAGQPAQRLEAETESGVAEAGSGDHVVGETRGAAREKRVPREEAE